MLKHFLCVLNLRTGATLTAVADIIIGAAEIIGGIYELVYAIKNKDENLTTLFVVCIFVGLINIFAGIILYLAVFLAKEKYVLCHLLAALVCLMITSIYAGINLFYYKWLIVILLICVILFYCQYSNYAFYFELREYNTTKSGVIEIAYNPGGYTNTISPEVENTPV